MNKKIDVFLTIYYMVIIPLVYPLFAYSLNTLAGRNLPEFSRYFFLCFILVFIVGILYTCYLKKRKIGVFTFILTLAYLLTTIYDTIITYP